MRVAVEKIPGVDSVEVSLNEGYADVALAESNAVTVEQVRSAIRKNGFSPRETRVQVRGTVARQDTALIIRLPHGTSFSLLGPGEEVERLAAMEGSRVTLVGDLPASESATAALPALRVLRIEAPQPHALRPTTGGCIRLHMPERRSDVRQSTVRAYAPAIEDPDRCA